MLKRVVEEVPLQCRLYFGLLNMEVCSSACVHSCCPYWLISWFIPSPIIYARYQGSFITMDIGCRPMNIVRVQDHLLSSISSHNSGMRVPGIGSETKNSGLKS